VGSRRNIATPFGVEKLEKDHRVATRWILSQKEEDESKYRKYKKVFVKVAARAQELYYKQMFDSKMNTVKKLWTT